MKVVARMQGDTYLVEAHVSELASLANKPITHKESRNYYNADAINIGTTFDIAEAWKQIHRNRQRKAEIESIRKNLEGVIAHLDMVTPFMEEPNFEAPAE